MTHEVDRWDAEEWLQQNKDIWNHPIVTDRTESNAYEVADLMADFANYILSKQEQKPKDMKQTAVEWYAEKVEQHLLTFGIIQTNVLYKFKEQAKEMEKQQIENAYRIGSVNELTYGDNKAEQYYKKTYGGNK